MKEIVCLDWLILAGPRRDRSAMPPKQRAMTSIQPPVSRTATAAESHSAAVDATERSELLAVELDVHDNFQQLDGWVIVTEDQCGAAVNGVVRLAVQ